jgi:hypothetical protein
MFFSFFRLLGGNENGKKCDERGESLVEMKGKDAFEAVLRGDLD